METYPDFRDLFKNLNAHGVEYVIVGAHAVAHHGWPRYTQDLDVLLAANAANAERIVRALHDFGFTSSDISTSDFDHPGLFFRLGRPPVQIDLLTDIPGAAWEDIWANRSIGTYDDQAVAYIGRQQLIQAKRASGRPYDIGDIENLGEKP